MKKLFVCLPFLLLFVIHTEAQFYFKGEVTDAKNNPLPYARIQVYSTNLFYSSGSLGVFGIPSSKQTDSVTISLNGYEEKKVLLNSTFYNTIILKPTVITSVQKGTLLSVTKNIEKGVPDNSEHYGETYIEQKENSFVETKLYPTTGFSMNIDKASYSNIRRFINRESPVPVNAVRIEEMLNYFPQKLKEPVTGKTFFIESQLTDCPWCSNHRLLYLRLHARKINTEKLPASNLVFLIDVSGSMDLPNRLPLLKTAFRMLVQNLREVDTISIMVYGGAVGIVLQPTSGKEKEKIIATVDSLSAAGDTPGESALRQAYILAQRKFKKEGNNRIILATDGDFNVGEVSEEAMIQLITQKKQTGIYLTCLGVGMGNYKDSKLEVLSKKGNGNFAYLDNNMEAEKVLVKEFTQTLYSVANDAYLNVTFNPEFVQSYRLIGYDNRNDQLHDTINTVEGGEIGTGHIITAVFEIELTKPDESNGKFLASAELNFKEPETSIQERELFPLQNNYVPFIKADSSYRFSTAVIYFGMLLKKSPYLMGAGWDQLLTLLPAAVNTNDYWQKEMATLILKAKEIYKPVRQKKSFFKKKKKD
jgi:Ca-activated chloride channel homolog